MDLTLLSKSVQLSCITDDNCALGQTNLVVTVGAPAYWEKKSESSARDWRASMPRESRSGVLVGFMLWLEDDDRLSWLVMVVKKQMSTQCFRVAQSF